MGRRNDRSPLRPLPVSTFGEVAELGYELHVWYQTCKTSRQIEITSALWAGNLLVPGFAASASCGMAGSAANLGCRRCVRQRALPSAPYALISTARAVCRRGRSSRSTTDLRLGRCRLACGASARRAAAWQRCPRTTIR
jgi:hypothetical protein